MNPSTRSTAPDAKSYTLRDVADLVVSALEVARSSDGAMQRAHLYDLVQGLELDLDPYTATPSAVLAAAERTARPFDEHDL